MPLVGGSGATPTAARRHLPQIDVIVLGRQASDLGEEGMGVESKPHRTVARMPLVGGSNLGKDLKGRQRVFTVMNAGPSQDCEEGRNRYTAMNSPKTSVGMGPIIASAVMTLALAILALVSLRFVVDMTAPAAPYPMDAPGNGIFILLCFSAFLVLALCALFAGITTWKAYRARHPNASISAPQAGESQSDGEQASDDTEA